MYLQAKPVVLAAVAAFTASFDINAQEVPPNNPAGLQKISPLAPSAIPDIDPLKLYGENIVYDVFRKGQKVGEHRMHFSRQGDRLSVAADFTLEIPFLFFTAYRYEYESTEVWAGETLVALEASVNDNGKQAHTSARWDGDVFRVEGPRGPAVLTAWIFPTNHWHRGQVNAPVILNTLTGRVSHVQTVGKGINKIETASGTVQAEHFVYTGDLRDTDVWYDAQGRWVKMRFVAKGDNVLEYICRVCGLPEETMELEELQP